MTDPKTTRATVMPKGEFNALFGKNNSIKAEVGRILLEAQDVARTLQREISNETLRRTTLLAEISDAELKKFIDAETLKRSAQAFAAMLDQSAKLNRDFVELTPWLATLVNTCVRRVIGTLDDADVVSRLVDKSIAELREQSGLILSMHPDQKAGVQDAIARYPDRFVGVVTLETCQALKDGQIRVRSAGELVEVDLTAQLDRIIDIIDVTCAADTQDPEVGA